MSQHDDRPVPVPRGPYALLGLLAISGTLLYVLPACGDDSSSFDEDTTSFETEDTTFGDDFTTTGFTTTGEPTPTPTGADTSNVDTTTTTTTDDTTTTTVDPTTSTESGSETTSSGGPVTCDPDNAMFAGMGIPQAGIEIDFDAMTCSTVSGFSKLDQIIIDSFSDGVFGGSGSAGLTVISVDGGEFINDADFYLLDNLVVDMEITIVYETMGGQQFTVRFTIDSATNSLTGTSVEFN